jgi:hypothetical protein
MLQVYYNGSDWVIAESVEDAIKVWEETTGDKWADYASEEDPDEWTLDNRKSWSINFEDEDDARKYAPNGGVIIHADEKDYFRVEAFQEQWIDKQGRSWFCSENY